MNTIDLNRLKACREKLGITKQEAARRINVSQPAYLRYESGQRAPSIQVINEMANVFNTSVDYLIGLTDSDCPDTYVVSTEKDPVLFDLISSYNQLDASGQKRLLAYMKKLMPNA